VPIARAHVARFTRAIPQSASPASHALYTTNLLSKFHHGIKLWASQNIFAGIFNKPFLKYGHILGKTLCSGPQAPAWQASPWGHRPSSSGPCAVPMTLSRVDQHIQDEPCAKRRALLSVFSSRYSSVFRDVRSACSIFTVSPLVQLYQRVLSYPGTVLY
jgi:hypothetical protein